MLKLDEKKKCDNFLFTLWKKNYTEYSFSFSYLKVHRVASANLQMVTIFKIFQKTKIEVVFFWGGGGRKGVRLGTIPNGVSL